MLGEVCWGRYVVVGGWSLGVICMYTCGLGTDHSSGGGGGGGGGR